MSNEAGNNSTKRPVSSVSVAGSQGPSTSEGPRRGLISPATVVHIKQVFGRAADKAQDTQTAILDDWKRVRRTESGEAHLARQSTYSNNPRNSTASAFLSPRLVQEPGSYVDAKNLDADPQEDVDDYSTDDSHSGDEYTHLKKRHSKKQVLKTVFNDASAHTSQDTSRIKRLINRCRPPDITAVQRGILKCSVAYLCAIMFTFVPYLSDLFAAPFELEGAPVAGAHVIATVSTYYNPAKTLGAMIEADIFMLWASLFAFIACIGSMTTAVVLNELGYHDLSHIVVVGFWLVGSMGLVAWMKVKVSNAQFGSACSMVALIITSVMCKEGSIHAGVFQFRTISQTFATVILGTVISNLVCFLLWRGSATSKLQGDINKTLEGFGTLLDLLCRSFLDEDVAISDETLKKSIEAHRSSFTALKTSLGAAKLELWDYRIQRTVKAYDKIVTSMNRLAQHLSGVRSAVILERELDSFREQQSRQRKERIGSLADEAVENGDIMATFQEHVGPSLHHLAVTLRHALRDVRASFIHSRAGEKISARSGGIEGGKRTGPDGLEAMKQDIRDALANYKTAHTKSVKRLYRHYPSNLSDEENFMKSSVKTEVDTRPNEEIFLIYHFCFNLGEFAEEQTNLIEAFRAIQEEEDILERERQSYRGRFGAWAHFVETCDFFKLAGEHPEHYRQTHRWATLKSKLVQLMPFSSNKGDSPFPATDDKAVTSHSAAQARQTDIMSRLRWALWRLGQVIKRQDILHAVKTGLGCGIMGAFAFDHRTRPIFVTYSGNWAILSYMVVVSTTIGATNFNAFFRICGTFLGATVATVAWYVLFGHPVLLCISSVLFSIPCFWLILVHPKFATSGRFVLLSYNLTALYAYNVRDTNYDVEEIAFHRAVAVTVGTLWGVFVTRYIFPFEARKELRDGISELLLNMGYLYQRIVEHISLGDDAVSSRGLAEDFDKPASERTPLLGSSKSKDPNKEFVEMEMHLQVSLIKLGALLDHSKHEPRLKGPFPVGPYASILQTCQRLLDTLHAMRAVSTRPEFGQTIHRELILPSNYNRKEVAGNILLFMSLLASNLSLKAPLPPYLPPAEEARKRLIQKISSLPLVQKRAVRGTSAFLLYYSYALMEKDLIAQLEKVGSVFQYLFGVMGDVEGEGAGVERFENLFLTSTQEAGHRTVGSSRNSVASTSSDSPLA